MYVLNVPSHYVMRHKYLKLSTEMIDISTIRHASTKLLNAPRWLYEYMPTISFQYELRALKAIPFKAIP